MSLRLSSETTAEALAKEYNVSEKTIKRDGEFAEGLEILAKENPELKKEVLAGTSKISKHEVRALTGKASKKSKKKPKPLSANQVASIAYEYLQTESRGIETVCEELGESIEKISPIKFFLKWNEIKNETKK